MRSIAWLSAKGGVGKTSCAVNVASGLAKSGRRVLFIDADPQGNASMVFQGGQGGDGPTLYHVLTGEASAADAVRPGNVPGLDLIPADGQLADANVLLVSELGRERRLRVAMQEVVGYDVVVVDTSPAWSLVNVNTLNFVGEVYCPVDPGVFALAGLVKLREQVAGVVKFLDNPTLRLAGLVVNRVQRDNLSRDTEGQLRGAFGDLVTKTTVPASVAIGEAHARYQSVIDYAPRSSGARAFLSLTAEVIGHGEVNGSGRGVGGTPKVDRAGRTRRTG